MKKISKYLLSFGLLVGVISSCDEGDALVDQVVADTTRGAILRTIEIGNTSFNRFDTTSEFSIRIEEQDIENGGLLSELQVYLSFTDNKDDGVDNNKAESLLRTISASEFETGDRGLPVTGISFTLAEALSALGLVDGQFDGGDEFTVRLELVLTDGRTFTRSDASGNVTGGSFFSSPYRYTAGIKCIPVAPVTGDYELDLADSYGDGWDGAKITVTIDGTATDYTFTSGSAASFTITVPADAMELSFVYVPGNFEGEHSYTLTAPNGDTAAADGPGPTPGEIVLNICI
ncbi:hypothetical protein [Spongiivirga citrea]|uniref:Uncharacterized protein n=1 Tax=Spongiivirga citrea TaxID=1481457 RepID=A0A6M0CEN3_9FLAO|nr:hypothetical protein [Spongiivirga citrea]NER16211.1 hypothetical protein [Spongiivirga citrea]